MSRELNEYERVLIEFSAVVIGTTEVEFTGTPHAFGIRVRTTDEHFIEVHETLYNWRVVSIPRACTAIVDGAYCYLGKSIEPFARALVGALHWEGPDHGHPRGWDKNVHAGTWNDETTILRAMRHGK